MYTSCCAARWIILFQQPFTFKGPMAKLEKMVNGYSILNFSPISDTTIKCKQKRWKTKEKAPQGAQRQADIG